MNQENDDSQNFSENQPIATPTRGPGARLGVAREAAGLPVDTVARSLHLRMDVIHAIENDDYQQGIPGVFLRGYLRAYANLLMLPADEIINAFNQIYDEEVLTTHYNTTITMPQRRRTFVFLRTARRVAVGVILLGGATFVSWQYWQQPQVKLVSAAQEKQVIATTTMPDSDTRILPQTDESFKLAPTAKKNNKQLSVHTRI